MVPGRRAPSPRRGAPDRVEFATKPTLAGQMITAALEAEIGVSWVTGDEACGQDSGLRALLESRAKEAGSIGFDTEHHDRAAAEVDMASWMDARGAYRTVLERIVSLSDKQREVMGRCAIAGQPLGDAAKEMRIQVATARVHLHRARQALQDVRSQLQELGVIDTGEGRQ